MEAENKTVEGEEARERCVIKQVTIMENWSSVQLVTSGKQY
jgi:hypothetical protein